MPRPKFICLYLSYLDSISVLSYETRGKLLTAMLEYASTGTDVKVPKTAEPFWISVRKQIDRDLEKYDKICERNQINGVKGGRPRKTQMVSEKPKEKEKEKENENVKENENENEKEREKKKENKKEIPGYGDKRNPSAPFIPPNSEEVQMYALSQGISIDVNQFVDHYTSNGWMVGSNSMKDWKAAVRNWHRKEFKFGSTELEFDDREYGTFL